MVSTQRSAKTIFSILLVSLALASCLAKESAVQQQQQPVQAQPHQSRTSLLASKLIPQQPKARSARSLSDMFERVKNRIFGKKQSSPASAASATSAQIQPAASVNAAQRQPWVTDLNSLNSQFNPYTALSNGNFQWPAAANSQYFPSQYQFPTAAGSSYQSPSSAGANGMISSLDALSQAGSGQSASVSQPNGQPMGGSNGANSGLFSSASHLIAQYLSPSAGSSSGSPGQSQQGLGSTQQQQQQPGQQGILTPQQQQQQSQYQEFASILDSMVAQTGASNVQRQPNMNQVGGAQQSSQGAAMSGQQQSINGGYSNSQSAGINGVSDNDMSGSSSVQSYMPAASPQQASQKSSMVSLAEQLAPGAQFNKLISFPFSLSPNDDASKEGRYKLHIPFLNQHVKRSDQQAAASSASAAQQRAAQQQQQQINQYINSLYSQPQQSQSSYSSSSLYGQIPASAVPSQQLTAQASQVVPSIVSPSQSSGAAQSMSQSPSQSVSSSVSASSSSSSVISPQSASPSAASSIQNSPSISSSVSSSSSSSS